MGLFYFCRHSERQKFGALVYCKMAISRSVLDKDFTLFELRRVTLHQGKMVCYKMIHEIDDVAKHVILSLYNKIWEQGRLPLCWKHSVVVPIGKPGKDKTEVKSYRPIALTSNLCKLVEKMVTRRLVNEIEKRVIVSPYPRDK